MQTPTSFRRALAAGRDFRRGSILIERRRRAVHETATGATPAQEPRIVLQRAA
jgi:hypothetical protein